MIAILESVTVLLEFALETKFVRIDKPRGTWIIFLKYRLNSHKDANV